MISRQQHDLIEDEQARVGATPAGQSPAAQEARGMRHGRASSVSRGGLGVGQQPPRRAPARPGVRKGTAMDALQIFGMAGGS